MSFVEGSRGRRFLQLYMTHGAAARDSKRMRRRLAAIWLTQYDLAITDRMYERLGEMVPTDYEGNYIWSDYVERAPLRDLLDAITIAAEVSRFNNTFLQQVATIFLDENVGCRVDQHGIVHFAVDAEYERAAHSIIRGLDDPRYSNRSRHAVHGRDLSRLVEDRRAQTR